MISVRARDLGQHNVETGPTSHSLNQSKIAKIVSHADGRSGNSDLVVLYLSSDCVNNHAVIFNVEPFIEGCQVSRFRPQLRIGIPSGQLRFEEGLVVRLDPSSDGSLAICILRGHQIHGAVLFKVLMGDPRVILVWVCFVDPADCWVLVLEQDGSSIDHNGGVAVGDERGGESKADAIL